MAEKSFFYIFSSVLRNAQFFLAQTFFVKQRALFNYEKLQCQIANQ